MTQKPTIGDGIPKQIVPQILSVRTPTEARVVLGEDAQATRAGTPTNSRCWVWR